MWAKLSIKFSTPCLNFIKVDVDLLPFLADEQKISNSTLYCQLPVVILYKNGVEIYRYPGYDAKGRPLQAKAYKEKDMIRLFELDRIHNSTANIIPREKTNKTT